MENTKLKIGIVGMGPVGSILALHLHESGAQVVVCDMEKERMNLIRKSGLHLENAMKKNCYFKHAHTSISELAKYDLDALFLAVKATHLSSVLEEAAELKTEKLVAVSAQNGIDVELELAKIFGEDKTMRMVLNYAGNMHAPNVVSVSFFQPPNYIASINDACGNNASHLAELLSSVELNTKSVDSFTLPVQIWEKTILNSSLSALCAVTRFTMKEAMDYPGTVEIVERTIQEAVEVAEAEDIHFGINFVKHCLRYLKKGGHHMPSLAVDVMNHRETEINFFNGKIVEYGRKHYIPTPLNLAFTNMINAITNKNNGKKETVRIPEELKEI